jgi:transposase InsO family protein
VVCGWRLRPVGRSRSANELWVGDISHLRCWEGLVFFGFVLDAYGRMIVGWQLAPHMRTGRVLDARMAWGAQIQSREEIAICRKIE